VEGSGFGDDSTSNMVSVGDLRCYYSYTAKTLFLGLWFICFVL
jgi:hypothetical protein